MEALEKKRENHRPSRVPSSPPSTQKPEARGRVEGINPSTPTEGKGEIIDWEERRRRLDAVIAEREASTPPSEESQEVQA
jgi:hypothetical protein